MSTSENFEDRLQNLRGLTPPRAVTAGVIAGQSANTRCSLLTLANAAGVTLEQIFAKSEWKVPFGQASSAITRGRAFERMVKENGYAHLLRLLEEQLRFDVRGARIEDLRTKVPMNPHDAYGSLQKRADATRDIVDSFLSKDPAAPNLIDGGVLTVNLGGRRGFLEADALALKFEGPIRVGEIKSFPIVDGRADAEKIGSAMDQTAIYVLALQDLIQELGGDPVADVSTEVLLIGAKNTGMLPVLYPIDVSKRVRHHRRQLSEATDLRELLSRVPSGLHFPEPNTEDPSREMNQLAGAVGTNYMPDCLSFCGGARWCRDRAKQNGEPVLIGMPTLRLLPGVDSLERAVELAEGAEPAAEEEPAAEHLKRAEEFRRQMGDSRIRTRRRRGVA